MAWYRNSTTEQTSGGGGAGLMLVLIFVILLVVAIATGILYFRRTDGRTEIIIDEQKIESTAGQAVEKGQSVLRDAGEKLQEIGEREPAATPAP